MIKNSPFIALCIFSLVLLTSCAPSSPLAVASPTPFIPTDTQQALIDPVEKRCVQSVPVEKFSADTSDRLLVSSVDNRFLYLSDPLNTKREELRFESGLVPFDILISPDRKLAAITMMTADHPPQMVKLLLIDAAGVIKKEFMWNSEWGRIAAWLDNHRILIAKQADLQLSNYNPTTITLLDINTGQDVEIQSAYPDLNQVTIVNWGFINHIYSSDFTRVLYLTSKVDSGYVNYFALWDLENKQVLATLPIELGETWTPQWSPDGSKVLISGLVSKLGERSNDWRGKELFTIDASGETNRLTHFTDYYPGTVTIADYTWSPDGRNIAFWLQTDQMEKPALVTMNVSTGEIVNHCISALPFHAAIEPIWSSSGDYLLITRQESSDAIFQTLLMNVAQNVITQIGENVVPVGWMVSSEE